MKRKDLMWVKQLEARQKKLLEMPKDEFKQKLESRELDDFIPELLILDFKPR